MATDRSNTCIRDLTYHEVDLEEYFYAVDKATLMHLPTTALTKGHGHALRCFMPSKTEAYKFASAKGTWLVGGRQGDKLFAVTLPRLVSFNDERDECIAVFFRIAEKGAAPWVVCWQPPFVDSKGDKVLATDAKLTACPLSIIKEFKPIMNRSGGNMLTMANKCLAASAIFKHWALTNCKAVISFAQKPDAKANFANALQFLELTLRRSKDTPRISDRQPTGAAAQENNETELSRLSHELQLLEGLREQLSSYEPIYSLPTSERIIYIQSTMATATEETVIALLECARYSLLYAWSVLLAPFAFDLDRLLRCCIGNIQNLAAL